MIRLLDTAAAAVVILGAACLALACLRRASAPVRHLLCLCALAASLAVPVLRGWPALEAPAFTFHAAALPGVMSMPRAFPWAALLAAIWTLGTVLLGIRAAYGWLRVAHLRRRARLFDDFNGIPVRTGPVTSPLACGLVRPLIVLPESAPAWTPAHLRMALLHEAAHIARHDCWSNLLAQIVCAVYWFNPFAWMVARRAGLEQEIACDDAVLNAGVPADGYASFLLHSARALTSSSLLACAMNGRSSARMLHRRFTSLLAGRARKSGSSRRAHTAIIGACAAAAFLLVVVRPVWSGPPEKIGGDVTAPRLIYKVEPEYTDEAKAAGIEGTVILSVVITADGMPTNVQVKRGLDEGLDKNATKAVEQWRFSPGHKKGVPVDVQATIEINYRLK